jgi:hypothetical protein
MPTKEAHRRGMTAFMVFFFLPSFAGYPSHSLQNSNMVL